ncbi:hypothetical protein DFP72DRAFT_1062401 [Ephemerocybe angulata]|uniref:Uncharacterized protein n=1 Tax=Ephemerocybe angulata TaxID=980116 RepID=A0A8H6IBY6_9AGAR|nr:hypothetical protein DFP72DRAFT_1062401 [Tulosesus angulatus]
MSSISVRTGSSPSSSWVSPPCSRRPTFANILVTSLSAWQGDRPHTLMASVQLAQVVDAFVASDGGARKEGGPYTGNTMVAIIERASIVVMSTLRHIGDTGLLEEGTEKVDEEGVEKWLAGGRSRVEDGVDSRSEPLNV